MEKDARSRQSAERICEGIRQTFPDQEIMRDEYDDLIAWMPGKDPDDHVHAAAAAVRAPVTILTSNVGDFPSEPLAKLGVTVRQPDEYLCEVFDAFPGEVGEVISQMAADRRQPKMTVSEVLDALSRAGAVELSKRVRRELDDE